MMTATRRGVNNPWPFWTPAVRVVMLSGALEAFGAPNPVRKGRKSHQSRNQRGRFRRRGSRRQIFGRDGELGSFIFAAR